MVSCDADTTPDTAARRHPLAFLAGHYTIQAGAFLESLERSRLEPSPHTPRVDALIEILEALRTAVELRFPDAKDAISARAIESDDSGDGCAGERP